MREDTGRPELLPVFHISNFQRYVIVRGELADLEDILKESQSYLELQLNKLKQIETHLSILSEEELSEEDIDEDAE